MEPNQTPKNIEVIAKAIRRKSVLAFTYNQEQLVVEPIVLGVHKETGKTVLRCYKSFPPQVSDTKENWYLCDLEHISGLKTTPLRAKKFRNGGKTLEGDLAEVIEGSPDYIHY